jgi:hypothetical protein
MTSVLGFGGFALANDDISAFAAGFGFIAGELLLVKAPVFSVAGTVVMGGPAFPPVVDIEFWSDRILTCAFEIVPKTLDASSGSSLSRARYSASLMGVKTCIS